MPNSWPESVCPEVGVSVNAQPAGVVQVKAPEAWRIATLPAGIPIRAQVPLLVDTKGSPASRAPLASRSA